MAATAMNEAYEKPDEDGGFTWEYADKETYVVLALDPGGTSGWSIFGVHPEAMGGDPDVHVLGQYGNLLFWSAGEFTGKQHNQVDQIVDLANAWPTARLVTEDFKLRQLNAELSPVEINATIGWALRPRYWVPQMAALAMETVTDERQKALGFWVPGKPHARDAVKHGITFLKRQKERAVRAARGRGLRVTFNPELDAK